MVLPGAAAPNPSGSYDYVNRHS